jgi:hypothetical protein
MNDLQHAVDRLIAGQIAPATGTWAAARQAYAKLADIQRKTIYFSNFRMDVQFNPARVRSTTAPADPGARPCFLCAENRPPEQQGVRWREYDLLVNPYPIFERHLTIPSLGHIPQFLTGKIRDMVDLSAGLPGFTITFNGARAGASAPDHFHFQAVEKGVLPSETELPAWRDRQFLYNREVSVWAADGYLRPAIVVEGADAGEAAQAAEQVLACLKKTMAAPDEAQVNVLAGYASKRYTVVIFPRTARRPRQYEAPEPERFLFSPGAVELAGVAVTVRAEDFRRADAPLLAGLFAQLVPDGALRESIKNETASWLTASLK